jgi:hypothetical protein
LISQNKVTLIDGTVISGELLRMNNDTLFFKTSFIEELPVGVDMILSIEFKKEIDSGTNVSSGIEGAPGTGKLMLIITGPALTTSIRFRRGDDRETAAEANKIILRIKANDKVIYEKIDDMIDDEVRSEGWTILKNKFEFGCYEVPIPAGKYSIDVFVGNDLMNEYRNKFNSGAVSLSKSKENVTVYRDGVKTLVLKSSQPFLSMGSYDLKWVE